MNCHCRCGPVDIESRSTGSRYSLSSQAKLLLRGDSRPLPRAPHPRRAERELELEQALEKAWDTDFGASKATFKGLNSSELTARPNGSAGRSSACDRSHLRAFSRAFKRS